MISKDIYEKLSKNDVYFNKAGMFYKGLKFYFLHDELMRIHLPMAKSDEFNMFLNKNSYNFSYSCKKYIIDLKNIAQLVLVREECKELVDFSKNINMKKNYLSTINYQDCQDIHKGNSLIILSIISLSFLIYFNIENLTKEINYTIIFGSSIFITCLTVGYLLKLKSVRLYSVLQTNSNILGLLLLAQPIILLSLLFFVTLNILYNKVFVVF